jgi:hypothetical protein
MRYFRLWSSLLDTPGVKHKQLQYLSLVRENSPPLPLPSCRLRTGCRTMTLRSHETTTLSMHSEHTALDRHLLDKCYQLPNVTRPKFPAYLKWNEPIMGGREFKVSLSHLLNIVIQFSRASRSPRCCKTVSTSTLIYFSLVKHVSDFVPVSMLALRYSVLVGWLVLLPLGAQGIRETLHFTSVS